MRSRTGKPGNHWSTYNYDAEVVEADRLQKKSVEYAAAHLKVLTHRRDPAKTHALFHKMTYGPEDVGEFLLDCSAFGWRNVIEIFDSNLGQSPSATSLALKELLFDKIYRGWRQKVGSRKTKSELIILSACYFRLLQHIFADDREVFARVGSSFRAEQESRAEQGNSAIVSETSVEFAVSEAARIAGKSDWEKYRPKYDSDHRLGSPESGVKKTVDSSFLSIFAGWGLLLQGEDNWCFGADEQTWPGLNISNAEEAQAHLDKPFVYPTIPAWWAEVYEKEYLAE